MMSNRKKTCICLFVSFTLLFTFFPWVSAGASENKIAIIYDGYKEFGSGGNSLNSLVQMSLSSKKGVDMFKMDTDYDFSNNKYGIVFILCNDYSTVPDRLIQKLHEFNGKIVWIGKNFEKAGKTLENITYMPEVSKNIYDILGKSESGQKVYMLIDKIYPFIDLNGFIKKVDFLHNNGISFICSVMPVYENKDLDAMKRFCRALRYAQSKGGKIVLHSSVAYGGDIQGEDVRKKMNQAEKIYVDYGVYPVALDLPEGILYREDYKNLVNSTDSIFVERDDNLGVLDMGRYSMKGFNNVIQKMPVKNGRYYSNFGNAPEIGLGINVDMPFESFKDNVYKLLGNGIDFNDVDYLKMNIKMGDLELQANGSDIMLDGKDTGYRGNYFSKSEKTEINLEKVDMTSANRKMVKITMLVCILFITIVIISRRIDIKKFLR